MAPPSPNANGPANVAAAATTSTSPSHSQIDPFSSRIVPFSSQIVSSSSQRDPKATTSSPVSLASISLRALDRIDLSQTSTSTSITSLSVELKTWICVLLKDGKDAKDVANFRLVCKNFAEIGVRPLVETLRYIFTEGSLQNLVNISDNKNLCEHVRVLVYNPFQLEEVEYEDYEECKREGFRGNHPEDNGNTNITSMIQHDWKVLTAMYAEQELLIHSGTDHSAFKRALPKFPNLKQLFLDGTSNFEGFHKPSFAKTSSPTLALEPEFVVRNSHHHDEYRNVRAARSMLSGLQGSSAKLKSINLTGVGWAFFLDSQGIHLPLFDNLISFKIEFHLPYANKEVRDGEVSRPGQEFLHQILRRPKGLQTLALDFDCAGIPIDEDTDGPVNGSIYWKTVFGESLVLENLTSLDIVSMVCESGSLSSFFEKQVPNLRSLALRDLWLESRIWDWAIVFRSLRKHKLLESLELELWFAGEEADGDPHMLNFLHPHTAVLVQSILGRSTGNDDYKTAVCHEDEGEICPFATSTDEDILDNLEHFGGYFDEETMS